ncbi:MAG: hypothetical protein ACK55Z_21395, partial [bacterium]
KITGSVRGEKDPFLDVKSRLCPAGANNPNEAFVAAISIFQLFANLRVLQELLLRCRNDENKKKLHVERNELERDGEIFINSKQIIRLIPLSSASKNVVSLESLRDHAVKVCNGLSSDQLCAVRRVDFANELMRLENGWPYCLSCQ